MRPAHNKRMRGRHRKGPNPLSRTFESNGPDVKIRGTAQHIMEKYVQLARDSQASGDPVAAESYFQHAEHYFRLIAAAQPQFQPQQGGFFRPGETDVEDGEDDEDEGQQPFQQGGAQPYQGGSHQGGSQPFPEQRGQNGYGAQQGQERQERPYFDRNERQFPDRQERQFPDRQERQFPDRQERQFPDSQERQFQERPERQERPFQERPVPPVNGDNGQPYPAEARAEPVRAERGDRRFPPRSPRGPLPPRDDQPQPEGALPSFITGPVRQAAVVGNDAATAGEVGEAGEPSPARAEGEEGGRFPFRARRRRRHRGSLDGEGEGPAPAAPDTPVND